LLQCSGGTLNQGLSEQACSKPECGEISMNKTHLALMMVGVLASGFLISTGCSKAVPDLSGAWMLFWGDEGDPYTVQTLHLVHSGDIITGYWEVYVV
jgi:hypothetical protein